MANPTDDIKEDMENGAKHLKDASKQKANKLKSMAEDAGDSLEEGYEQVKDQVQGFGSSVCNFIQQRPFASLAIAAAIGFGIAACLKKND